MPYFDKLGQVGAAQVGNLPFQSKPTEKLALQKKLVREKYDNPP